MVVGKIFLTLFLCPENSLANNFWKKKFEQGVSKKTNYRHKQKFLKK
jgi:hypothetical protein